jgi:dihydroorotate dehydrogenase
LRPYRLLFDRVLTRTDPERAHDVAFRAIRAARFPLSGGFRLVEWGNSHGRDGDFCVPAMGLTFPNVLGLAAGFDKNGVGIGALAALGFGHVEIGTVTGEPQPGNPKPRLFRLPADRAVVNRMGFNNDGAEVVARRLARRRDEIPHSSDRNPPLKGQESPTQRGRAVLGVNIGKSKVVPEDDAVRDYEKSAGLLAPYADYLVVNVSSPNTPGLRNLQEVEKLEPLLRAVRRRADDAVPDRRVPLLVKLAPDLDDDDVLAVADLATAVGLDGIVATNTTITRDGLRTPESTVAEVGGGGLSGRPLAERSLEVLRLLAGRGGDLTLVSVGGISTVEDARARLDAGADLLQAYTAFVYEGPLWPRRILSGLAQVTP